MPFHRSSRDNSLFPNIIPFGLPAHTTHLLQPLDVVVFQPLKHWHSEAVNEAMQTGDENFTKLEFLAAFNSFRTKAFKKSTILSAWKATGLLPRDNSIVLNKIRAPVSESRFTTPPPPEFVPLAQTPKTIDEIAESAYELAISTAIPSKMSTSIIRFAKGALARARAGELAEDQLARTTMAENARKSRKQLARRVISKGGVLSAREARGMTRDRLELEEMREADRLKAWEKRYNSALVKVFKGTVKRRKLRIDVSAIPRGVSPVSGNCNSVSTPG